MKGSAEVIAQLNEFLKGEVTALNQYFLHASMCKNWGYLHLYKKIGGSTVNRGHAHHRSIRRCRVREGRPRRFGGAQRDNGT